MALSDENKRRIIEEEKIRKTMQGKSTLVSVLLSFVFPGLGDLYCGSWIKATVFLFFNFISFLLMFFAGIGFILYFIVWLFGLISAWLSASKSEREKIRKLERTIPRHPEHVIGEPADDFATTASASRIHETVREAEEPTTHTAQDAPMEVDPPLPPESTNNITPSIQHFAPSFPSEATPPTTVQTDTPITLPKVDTSATPKSHYVLAGLVATALLGYFGFTYYENKQELERMRVEKEVQERNAQQEAVARWTAEQQAEAERRARQEAAAREAEAERRAREAAVAEAEALRKAEQEAEAHRKSQDIEAQKIAREQAVAERKANLEIEAQRQYQNALAQIEKRYQYTQDDAKKRHAYGLARANGRTERLARAEKAYHDRLARAQKYHVEKRAQADARYQDRLAQIMKVYGHVQPNGQSQTAVTAQTAALQTKVTDAADLSPTAPSCAPSNIQSPAESLDIPAVKVGDTYVVNSQYPQNTKLDNTTERKVISVVDGEIAVASRNVRSTSGQPRILRFTREWNLVSSRNADGSGLDYSPPLKYFEFPLYPGKTWQQTSIEKNIKTGTTREFTLSATVGDWENIAVPAGTFRAIKITTQTTLLDGGTGQRSTGNDISWYAPTTRRSVKSLVTSRNMQGDVEEQLIQMAHYEIK